jgi:bifunctional non-homologous end joining protein LigD
MHAAAADAMPRAADRDRPDVKGIGISHPDRHVYPTLRFTKLDLARYYEHVAEWMLPHVVDRPLTLVRCPDGVGERDGKAGGCFYMKHSKLWAPEALRRVRIREKTKVGDYLVADSATALIALVQMGVMELHTWNSTCAELERPNRIVLDIDPGPRASWRTVVDAARQIRDLLLMMELQSFVKTTGGRGLHVVVPLVPRADWEECLAFARAVAELLVRRDPTTFTTRFAKEGREDLLLLDYLRNNRTNTSVAAYSTRARPEATVSVPLGWRELSPARPPDRFTVLTVPGRLSRLASDPWSAYWTVRQRLPRAAVKALDRM